MKNISTIMTNTSISNLRIFQWYSRIIFFALTILISIASISTHAQDTSPWTLKPYGNEWIVPSQKYARISVKSEGVFQVNISDLPSDFPTSFDPRFLQLWHRGKQVAMLEADASKIVFVGKRNEGASDELLCRPYSYYPSVTSRMNPYVSLFSDQGVYFLTLGSEAGLRAATIQSSAFEAQAPIAENYSMIDDTLGTVYRDFFSHTNTSAIYPRFVNSFHEYGKTYTGPRRTASYTITGLQLKKLSPMVSTVPPKVKMLIHSRCRNLFKIGIGVQAKGGVVREILTRDTDEYRPEMIEFDLQPGDYNAQGEFEIVISKLTALDFTDGYSISYVSVVYPQTFDLNMSNINNLNLATPSATKVVKVDLLNVPTGNTRFLNITNPFEPKIVVPVNSTTLSFEVQGGVKPVLRISNTTTVIKKESITTFVPLSVTYSDYQDKDYIIITNNTLFAGATEYASYRAATYNKKSGSDYKPYKPIVLKVDDIFNQYNYGEPSPIALRRCLDFMISDKNLDKFVLLIGDVVAQYLEHDAAANAKKRELPDQVPTIGWPGSDVLLVTGLAGFNQDFQTLPIGRIPTNSPAALKGYLEKVKIYESTQNITGSLDINGGLSWRKKLINVNGGKSAWENQDLAYRLKVKADQFVITSPFGGAYTTDSKSETCIGECREPISSTTVSAINSGVGIVSYFGHGSPIQTDKTFEPISSNEAGFVDTQNFFGMFIYGCDVNNVFKGNNDNAYNLPSLSNRKPFTVDYLMNPNRGAITVVGNTWEGYAETLTHLMEKEYKRVFVTDQSRKQIGLILKESINETMEGLAGYNGRTMAITPTVDYYNYNHAQANAHQTLLLGDPAIVLVETIDPLPVEWVSATGKLLIDRTVEVNWVTATEKNNSHFVVERSSDAINFTSIGTVVGKGNTDDLTKYSFIDKNPLEGINYYRILQKDRAEEYTGTIPASDYSRIIEVNTLNDDILIVSPNPSQGIFKIKLNKTQTLKSWNVVDVRGVLQKSSNDKLEFDLQSLPAGVYILELTTTSGQIYSRKLMKN